MGKKLLKCLDVVLSYPLKGSAMRIYLSSGEVVPLDKVSHKIWNLCLGFLGKEEIVEQVSRELKVSEETVRNCLRGLMRRGLIKEVEFYENPVHYKQL